MVCKRKYHDPSIRRRGFTLVECLIGLAISAVLLAAVAVAFNASLVSYGENEDMFRAINNARQAMARMTSQIRTAGYVDPNGTVWGVPHQTASSNQCELYAPGGERIRYEFRSADRKLYLVKITTNQEYVLCDGVTAATFTTTSKNGVDATGVQISLTVQSGNASRTLSGAAVVRRNLDS
jgi:prepilin-type N-terminal cleavage/methylation domain-containing protein